VEIDSDFAPRVRQFGAALAGVPEVPAAARIVMMEELISRHGDRLSDAVVTLRGNRIRFSRPPRTD